MIFFTNQNVVYNQTQNFYQRRYQWYMANNIQYYLNQGTPCAPSSSSGECLKKSNFFSEFSGQAEKEMALENLGVPDMIDSLVQEKTDRLIDAINRIWEKFGELTGETFEGILFTVTPSYYIGEDGCRVNVMVNTETLSGMIENLKLYVNNNLVLDVNNITTLNTPIEINETSVITCEALINGIVYTKSKTITHYSSFWLGAGSSYDEVMTMNNLRPIEGDLKGSYEVNVEAGQRIFIILGEALRDNFVRADMSGVGTFVFDEETITLNGTNYKVLVSSNPFAADTYTIHINS